MVSSVSQSQSDKKTPIGTYVGVAEGAGLGYYFLRNVDKNYKAVDSFWASDAAKKALESKKVEAVKDAIKNSNLSENFKNGYVSVVDNLSKRNGSKAVEVLEKAINIIKNKNFKPALKASVVAVPVLLGLGIGAIVDKIRNKD